MIVNFPSNFLKGKIIKRHCTRNDLIFKIVVIGSNQVGKTSITQRALHNVFDNTYTPTIGYEFNSLQFQLDSKIIKMQIWETSQQEMYRSSIQSLTKNAAMILLVYSVTNKESLMKIREWLKDNKHKINSNMIMILIGNKSDLDDERVVSYGEGEEFVKEFNINYFLETSACNGLNVTDIFNQFAQYLYNDYQTSFQNESYAQSGISLVSSKHHKSKEECKC